MSVPVGGTPVKTIGYHGLQPALEEWGEPGAAEVCQWVRELMGDDRREPTISVERLKRAVYRLRIGGAHRGRTVILKRHKPAIAQTDRFVVERWLPALGLGDRCPRILGAVAQRDGSCVWHVYEDLGQENLAGGRLPWRLEAAVDLIAQLHTRAARHPVVPEVRWRAGDHGAHFFTANVRDAISALEAISTLDRDVPPEFPPARARLLHRLEGLLEDAPRRLRVMTEVGGPDTLLHGDLWPKNIFVTMAGTGPQTRLIDWDHVGVGSFSYDLSTVLYQSSVAERWLIVRRYREAVERAGWRFPTNAMLNLLCHTAESARYAHCILFDAMALLNDGDKWGIRELVDYAGWFDELRPPLPG